MSSGASYVYVQQNTPVHGMEEGFRFLPGSWLMLGPDHQKQITCLLWLTKGLIP